MYAAIKMRAVRGSANLCYKLEPSRERLSTNRYILIAEYLAETINGLYKAEVIHHMGPWKGFDDVEYATLEWVDWYNKERLFGTIGYVPPAESEAEYWEKEFMQAA